MLYCQKREPVYVHVNCTAHSANRTCSGVTHTNRGAQRTPKPKPPSTLPINTSRVIIYSTLGMTFVTTSNCNTVDNIYVKKHLSFWDPRMGTVIL